MNYKSGEKSFLFLRLTLIFFFLSVTALYSQGRGTIRGIVTDSTNGEALAFCNVLVNELNIGASTDSHGLYIITSVPARSKYTLIVSYVGYQTKKIILSVTKNKITELNVALSPVGIKMETVETVGEKVIGKNATDIGLQRISMRDIEMLPKGVEADVFRSLQYLPGVRSTGDVSARYYVRGSSSNENLVLLNGITIYNPFHAFGMFSVIDPDMINSVEFYKGGFTSEIGDRLSSVLDIITKDGNKNTFAGSATSSFLTGKVLFEGPIPNGSFMITGRKSYYSEILKKFLNDKSAPIDFYDMSLKLNYSNPNFIKGSKFDITGFISGDNLNNNSPYTENMSWSNKLLGLDWFQLTDSPLYFEIGISWSNFKGEVDPKLSSAKPKNNQLDDITTKMDFNYIFPSKDELSIGTEIKDVNTTLYLENSLGAISDIGSSGTNISVYGKYKFLRYENFGADVGARIAAVSLLSSSDNPFMIQPRVSMTYRIFPAIALKGSWGIYEQELTTLSDENEVISLFEPWIIIPDYLKPAGSIQYSIGMTTDFTSSISLDVEGYYKIMKNIPTLNDNKISSTDPDLISATGESYGWEFLFRFNNNPFAFTASYTLSWAYKDVNGWLYYPRYDSRNSIDLTLEYNFGNDWYATITWVYNTGLPFTQSLGFYNKLYFNDLYSDWPIYENYQPLQILSDKDLGRLPDYHRLDLSLSKSFNISWVRFRLDASIINVYNRANIFYFKRDTGERVNMLPFLPTATIKIEL